MGDGSNLVCVFGKKRMGKSTLGAVIVDEHAREGTHFWVLDSTREWISKKNVQVFRSLEWSLDDFTDYVLGDKRAGVAVVDEVDRYAPNHMGGLKPGTGLHKIVNEGRHLDVALLCMARRVARVHTDLGYLADTIFLLKHTGPNDLDWIGKVCGKEYADAARSLEPHEFLRCDL